MSSVWFSHHQPQTKINKRAPSSVFENKQRSFVLKINERVCFSHEQNNLESQQVDPLLKALGTFGWCQRPVFLFGVSKHNIVYIQ